MRYSGHFVKLFPAAALPAYAVQVMQHYSQYMFISHTHLQATVSWMDTIGTQSTERSQA